MAWCILSPQYHLTHLKCFKQCAYASRIKIEWAKNNDEKARKIAENARQFAITYLLPDHVLCYHAAFLSKWSKLLSNKVEIGDEMVQVKIDKNIDTRFKPCSCKMDKDENYNNASSQQLTKDEL